MNAAPRLAVGEPETPERDGAFPRLDETQLERLRGLGEVRAVEPGDVLFAEGDRASDFFVIESGMVAIVQGYGRRTGSSPCTAGPLPRRAQHAHRAAALPLGVVRDKGEVIQIPLQKLRELVDEDKTLSDLILGAFMARRSILIDAETGIKLDRVAVLPESAACANGLPGNRMPHQWIDLERDQGAEALLSGLGIGPDETPVVVASGGEILRNPTNVEVARAIGSARQMRRRPSATSSWSGRAPPGSRPPCYAASEGLDTQGSRAWRPEARPAPRPAIENYLGFPAGVSGSELTQRAGVQAIKFGVRLTAPAAARGLKSSTGRHEIELSTGEVATGAARW